MNIENNDNESFNDDLCPSIQMFSGILLSDKPFGYYWPRSEMVEFLKELGYSIVEKPNPDENFSDIPIQVAIKKSDKSLPDMDNSNIEEVFSKEVRRILFKWLLSIDKK